MKIKGPDTLPSRGNPEVFMEMTAAALYQIYDELSKASVFTPETLNTDKLDLIVDQLRKLEMLAEEKRLKAQAEVFRRIRTAFYLLLTTGIADKRDRFSDKAADAFQLLEIALLSLGGAASKYSEKVMTDVEERKERY